VASTLPEPPGLSIRQLAQNLGLAPSTVSGALRDLPQFSEETRRRVQAGAAAAGYRPNSLVGRVMSEVRRSRSRDFRGAIAALNAVESPNAGRDRFHQKILQGAVQRGQQFGYQIEPFRTGPGALSLKRINSVLHSRNIQGAIVMPFEAPQDWSELEWSRLSAVRMFNPMSHPRLHSIGPDHHALLLDLLERLTARGHRRIGLFLKQASDSRLRHRWTAAFHVFAQSRPARERIPPLLVERVEPDSFNAWFSRHRPTVVVGHYPQVIEWLGARGVWVPRDVGFVNLNRDQEPWPCAGLDLMPEVLGAMAVDAVVAQINRNERGLPPHPQTIAVEGKWVDGPTLAAPSGIEPPSVQPTGGTVDVERRAPGMRTKR